MELLGGINRQSPHIMKKGILLAAFSFLGTIATHAALIITEDFSGSTINPNLVAPSEFLFGPNSTPVGTAQNPSGLRRYVTTTATDFNTMDFVFEITFSVNGTTPDQTPFFGMGSGLADPNFFFEPHTSIYLRQFPDAFESGQLRATISSGAQVVPNQPPEFTISPTPGPGNGTHRAQLKKIGDLVTLSMDENYAGGAFTADYSFSRNLSTDLSFLNSTNSRLFFGVQSGATTFDNLSIVAVPEPSNTVILVGGILLCAGITRYRSRCGNRLSVS